jgi:uncharacterized repeat protein (TIGR03803 family)
MTQLSSEKPSIVSNSVQKLLLLAGALLVLIASPSLQAGVVFTTLHSFTTNLNGGLPYAPPIQGEDGFLYGMTTIGGVTRLGTVYRAGTNGMFTLLYSFTNGIDGSHPTASLVQGTDGNFYGTAERGGTNGHGTIFQVSSNGVFNPLYSFTGGADGGAPESALIEVAGGEFYGTASTGGAAGYGTVYEINTQTNPAQFILLYTFTNGMDGATPASALVSAGGGVLYGTATSGGASSHGAIFELTSAGAFSPLYSFTNGLDGSVPLGLTLGSDGLYGMAQSGGIANAGTIFKMTFGGALTALYSFTNGADGILTEYGAPSVGSLALGSDGAFYGVADDGSNYTGTIFKITPQGAFALVTSFDQIPTASFGEASEYYFNVGGNVPTGLTLGIDGNLYGTATYGGGGGYGTILELVSNSVIVPFFAFGFADGKYPDAGVIQGADGNFYGPTYYGGLADQGAIFKMDVAGNTSLLYSFTNGLDGAVPDAPLTVGSDGNLFGTTFSAFGTVFRLTFDGVLTTLHKFTNGADGSFPSGPLGQFGSDFYGTTDGNTYINGIGAASYGTVFEISTNGTLNTLHTFATTDGTPPLDGVTEASDGNFYGATFARSSNNFGGIFKITPSGVFTSLYAFTGAADGAYPIGGLVQANDGSLYGTTSDEGRSTFGGIFRISTNGLFTPLYSFTNGLDGSSPNTTLLRAWDGNLYGTTGTEVFQVTTNGVLTVLYSFTNFVDFLGDPGPLLQATDGDLYGTTTGGGIFGVGTVFRLAVPMPPVCLSANLQAGQANFTWRAVSGLQYQAQYTTNLAQANWLNLGVPIGATNGLANFSDPIAADSQRFYRLLTW